MIKESLNDNNALLAHIFKSKAPKRFAIKHPAVNRLLIKRNNGLSVTLLRSALVVNLLLMMDIAARLINSKEFFCKKLLFKNISNNMKEQSNFNPKPTFGTNG